MTLVELARKYRPIIVQAMQGVDDQTASEAPHLYDPPTYDGSLIKAGTKINWRGEVLKAASDCWDREDQSPENAPNLWEHLAYHDGIRIIPETITVTSAFSKGERGWWKDQVWVSRIDNNVWTPAQNPDGWEAV